MAEPLDEINLIMCDYTVLVMHVDNRKMESLPSSFLNKLASSSSKSNKKSKKVQQIFTYDRDIVCLTEKFVDKNGTIKIPRSSSSLEYLCRNNLKGKIQLTSCMSEDEIMDEIRSVFDRPFCYDKKFPFKIVRENLSV